MQGLGAIVLAGGRGTRLRSAWPKALHRVLGLPLGAWPVRAALAAGADPVIVVVGDPTGAVEAAIRGALPEDAAERVRFALQAAPLGTADAVSAARAASEGVPHLLLLNGDLPLVRVETLDRLVATYEGSGGALALTTCVLEDGGAYGRVLRDERGAVDAIREARDASDAERAVREVNVGAYLARRDLLFDGLARLDARNAQGELYLTDLVHVFRGDGHVVGALVLEDPEEMQGVNTRGELALSAAVLRDRVLSRWMEDGVTMEDPATTWIEPDVTLARDIVLGPGVVLRGRTAVGEGCVLGPGVLCVDATLAEGVTVGAHAVLERVRCPKGLVVPPLSHLTRE